MVPLVVAPVAGHLGSHAVRAVHQFIALESDVELVLGTAVLLHAASVAQQCTATVGIGLKPEHQCVVLLAGAIQGILCQLKSVVFLLYAQRHSAWQCPVGTYQRGVGTLSAVGSIFTRALVHWVVVHQILLVARQSVSCVCVELSAVHGAVPQASLHHTALIVLTGSAVVLVGTTEDECSSTVVEHVQLLSAIKY